MISDSNDNHTKRIRRSDITMKDMDILDRYFHLPRIPCSIASPLRQNDKNPSLRIWEKNGKVYWKDFGTDDGGTIIGLLANIWNISFEDALERIYEDTASPLPHYSLVRHYKGRIRYGSGNNIKVKVRAWKKYDTQYWASYGITQKMCEFAEVYPISNIFFIDDEGNKKEVRADKYAYAYFEWKDGKCTIKAYQPYSERIKWLSTHDRSTWDLWTQAMAWADKRSDEECIITSSRKDAMCLWCNLNVPAMCLQGEGYLPKPHVMRQVLKRFKKVYLWYDNDYGREDGSNPGQDNAHKLIEEFPQLHNICIPEKYKAKDPSDLYKAWGKDILKTIYDDTKL